MRTCDSVRAERTQSRWTAVPYHSELRLYAAPESPLARDAGLWSPRSPVRSRPGRLRAPTWCNPTSMRPCHGRDPGLNPGVGVCEVRQGLDGERKMFPFAIVGCSSRQAHPAGAVIDCVGGAGPGRVCNLHDPVWHSRGPPEASPCVRRGNHDREGHDSRVVHAIHTVGRWSSGRRLVSWVHAIEVRILVGPCNEAQPSESVREDSSPASRSTRSTESASVTVWLWFESSSAHSRAVPGDRCSH